MIVRVHILDTNINLESASALLLELHALRDDWETVTSLRTCLALSILSHGRWVILYLLGNFGPDRVRPLAHQARPIT